MIHKAAVTPLQLERGDWKGPMKRASARWVALSLLLPTAIGGIVTGSWKGALTAYLWAGVVRLLVLHHA